MSQACVRGRRRPGSVPVGPRSGAWRWAAVAAVLPLCVACKRTVEKSGANAGYRKVGLVADIAGRGDQSFNDSALRGLELWAAGKKYTNHTYRNLSGDELQRSLP